MLNLGIIKLKLIFVVLFMFSRNIYCRTSPTRHQIISGIGIPLNLENEAITLGLVFKAQYFLPENANQLKPIYFPGIFGKRFS